MRPSEKIYNGIICPYQQITFGIPIKYMSPEMFPGIDGTFYVDALGSIYKISERGVSKLKSRSVIIEDLVNLNQIASIITLVFLLDIQMVQNITEP